MVRRGRSLWVLGSLRVFAGGAWEKDAVYSATEAKAVRTEGIGSLNPTVMLESPN